MSWLRGYVVERTINQDQNKTKASLTEAIPQLKRDQRLTRIDKGNKARYDKTQAAGRLKSRLKR
jgi:hypothetical protein